jgi:predicted SprT family Zn-dependent metalloprotease
VENEDALLKNVKKLSYKEDNIYIALPTTANFQKRLKTQYWFDCACVACTENWPLMHEMTDDSLTFRCEVCNNGVRFVTDSNNPLLRCVCGTPVPMLQVRIRLAI